MQNSQVRRLTEGALMAAVFTVLLALSVYVPVLNVVTALFMAVPAAWYSAKYGWKPSLLFAFAALILSALIGGLLSLPLALLHLPFGLAVGLSLHYKKTKLFMLIASTFALLGSLLLQYMATIWLLGINVLQEMMAELETAYAQTGELLERFGADMEQYNLMVNQMMFSLENLFPALFVLAGIILVWILLLIYLPLLKRLGAEVPKFPPFRELRLPRSLIWYYLAVLLLPLLFEAPPGTMLYMALVNLMLVLSALFFLQGISFYHFYIDMEGWPNWVKVVVTIFAIPLQSFTSIVGMVDILFNIRGWLRQAHDFKGK